MAEQQTKKIWKEGNVRMIVVRRRLGMWAGEEKRLLCLT